MAPVAKCLSGLVVLGSTLGGASFGQPLTLQPIANGLASPVALTHAGDDRLFITLQGGRVVIWRSGAVLATPFLDIDPLVQSGGEQGLLSVAFHPNYQQNGLFFVNYTQNGGDTVIARYRVSADPDRADAGSAALLLRIDQPFANHNGGQLQFGPDGMLYVGMGDGGSGDDPQCNGQRTDSLLGKMLRLDVNQNTNQSPFYGVPADNPFRNGPYRAEVWAVGLRNPWRFSFDRQGGDLYLGDVGQGQREEVDYVARSAGGGQNFGWKMMEGSLCRQQSAGCPGAIPGCNAPQYTAPAHDYQNTGSNCSVTGGYVYRGAAIPALAGDYLFGDFCSGIVWAAERQGSQLVARDLGLRKRSLSSFGEGRDGELYVLSLDGTVSRLAGAGGANPEPGSIEQAAAAVAVGEGAGSVVVRARRTGGADGAVTVVAGTQPGTATSNLDFTTTTATLSWADGEQGDRSVAIAITQDVLLEGPETFSVVLQAPTGGATLGNSATTVTISDDDLPPGGCVSSASVLCLNGGRFHVAVTWRDHQGRRGSGTRVPLTTDSGTFWFFRADNVELVVKVLDACGPFNRYWVFAAGLTDVETRLTVFDTLRDQLKVYTNPLGTPFAPLQDTSAFATCP